ncbi:MAG: T9SS type A sorting domain-containing protein, partial [Bacteroidales bacterium]|nr:T9SS type A sorting domain-containing protein [Bacteroidales bacterium]
DSYGDGGHQATDIVVTITKTYIIYPWLSVDPIAGIVEPGGSQTIQVTCNGSILPLGDYEGTIMVTSNDPDFAAIEIPVYFHVDFASEINQFTSNEIQVVNYPNPFSYQTTFDIYLPSSAFVELEIYNFNGQKIHTIMNDKFPAGIQSVRWQGNNSKGSKVKSGIYFYRLRIGKFTVIRKLILMDE